jgi:hypothetical protein
MPNSGPRIRSQPHRRCARLPLRWEYGFNGTKISAWFEALPLKLKPANRENPFHFRNILKNRPGPVDRCAFVYSSDAPDGACTAMMKYP